MALVGSSNTAAAERASGSSFYNAMRILPRAQREAMFEIYSFCRQVDDIADSSGPRSERREQLERWRADIDGLYVNKSSPRTQGLAVAVREFGLRREDFHAVIDGMEMDVLGDIRAPDDAALDLYCNRVASAVGRLSVRVFGMEEQEGIALAHHLGRQRPIWTRPNGASTHHLGDKANAERAALLEPKEIRRETRAGSRPPIREILAMALDDPPRTT